MNAFRITVEQMETDTFVTVMLEEKTRGEWWGVTSVEIPAVLAAANHGFRMALARQVANFAAAYADKGAEAFE